MPERASCFEAKLAPDESRALLVLMFVSDLLMFCDASALGVLGRCVLGRPLIGVGQLATAGRSCCGSSTAGHELGSWGVPHAELPVVLLEACSWA